MKNKEISFFNIEQRIIHHIILYSKSIKDVGLFHGKMGIAILFMHLYRCTDNNIYEDIANDLIDDIWEEVNTVTSFEMASGLSGIGLGIEYLLHHKFAEGESLGICKDLDVRIMRWDSRRISDYSIDYGIGGLLEYILTHIKACMKQSNIIPFDDAFLKDLFDKTNMISEDGLDSNVCVLIAQYQDFYTNRQEPHNLFNLKSIASPIEQFKEDRLLTYPLGLKKGLGGLLLDRIALQ